MRAILGLLFMATMSVLAIGCGAELSKRDLGHVVFEVPKVAGADKPYEMPKLAPRSDHDQDDDGPQTVPPRRGSK
jgi:hypothetical protein